MQLKISKTIGLLGLLALVGGAFFWWFQPSQAEEGKIQRVSSSIQKQTYQSLLESGLTPALSPDYEFPTNFQYLNGCFGYAVGHILQERGHPFDPLDMEKRIE